MWSEFENEWVYIPVWSELYKNECLYQCDQSCTRMSVYTSVIRVVQEWMYIQVWSELNKNECIYQYDQSWTRMSVYTSVIRVVQEWMYIQVWSELNKNECIYQCDQSWTRMSVFTSAIRVEQDWYTLTLIHENLWRRAISTTDGLPNNFPRMARCIWFSDTCETCHTTM